MVKRQVTFTADEEIQEIIKESDIPDKKQSKWINEKIKLGLQFEKNPKKEPQEKIYLKNLEVKI